MKITKKDKNGNLVTYEGLIEILYAELGCSGCLIIIILFIALLSKLFG